MFLHLSVCPQAGSRPMSRGCVSALGVSRSMPRGVSAQEGVCPWVCPGSGLRGVQAQARGCIPACTEADPPADGYCPPAEGYGTHLTGMHSC